MHQKKKSTSQENLVGMGIALGSGVGITFGIVFNNIPMGVAIGAALGLIFSGAYVINKR